jgi:hypothetical protein
MATVIRDCNGTLKYLRWCADEVIVFIIFVGCLLRVGLIKGGVKSEKGSAST